MRKFFTIMALAFWVIGSAGQPRTNCLSLLVLTNEVHFGAQMEVPSDLTKPVTVLSDADFVKFDVLNHTFTLTPKATQRLGWKLGEMFSGPYVHATGEYALIPNHAEFVWLAFGKPVYCGIFCPGMICSFGHADGVPTIVPERPFVSTNLTANVRFKINRWPLGAVSEPAHDGILEDPRLIAAARELHAAENRKPEPKSIQPAR